MQGTLKAPIKVIFVTYLFGFFGHLWAHMGPARALGEQEKFKKDSLFLRNTFFSKIIVFDLQTKLFDGKTAFFRLLAEIRLRTLIKSHQKASSRPKKCKLRTTCTLPQATVRMLYSDCSLSQGAGGTEFALLGLRTWFLR